MLNISEQSRRSPKELKAEVLDFLQQHRVAVLSTLTPDNKPYAAPVIYAVDNSFHFYFFTRSDSKKYVGLAKDCLVSLVVYDEQEPQVVQTEGCASLEEDEQAIKEMSAELIKISMDSSPWYDPPIAKMTGGDFTLVKFHPKSLRYGDFRGSKSAPSPFKQVLP